MKEIRVLNVLPDDRLGGSSVRILSLSKILNKKGIEYIIALPHGRGKVAEYARKEGLKVFRMKLGTPHYMRNYRALWLNFLFLINFLPSVFSLMKIIRKENIDIVHLNGFLCLQGGLAALLTGKKVVWHLMGTMFPRWMIKIVTPFINLTSDRVINISENTKKHYLRKKSHRDMIIHEPVDTDKFNPESIDKREVKKLREELGIKENKIIIGSVGNVTWVKRYEDLITALKYLGEEYHLILSGKILSTQPGYFNKLKNLSEELKLSERVDFLGLRKDIPSILSLMDVFVLPSIHEGTPISILEAMSMKIPVVATDVGGIPEQIEDKVSGILIKPGKPEEIKKAVEKIINNPSLRNKLTKNARKTVVKYFSLNKITEKYITLYRSMM